MKSTERDNHSLSENRDATNSNFEFIKHSGNKRTRKPINSTFPNMYNAPSSLSRIPPNKQTNFKLSKQSEVTTRTVSTNGSKGQKAITQAPPQKELPIKEQQSERSQNYQRKLHQQQLAQIFYAGNNDCFDPNSTRSRLSHKVQQRQRNKSKLHDRQTLPPDLTSARLGALAPLPTAFPYPQSLLGGGTKKPIFSITEGQARTEQFLPNNHQSNVNSKEGNKKKPSKKNQKNKKPKRDNKKQKNKKSWSAEKARKKQLKNNKSHSDPRKQSSSSQRRKHDREQAVRGDMDSEDEIPIQSSAIPMEGLPLLSNSKSSVDTSLVSETGKPTLMIPAEGIEEPLVLSEAQTTLPFTFETTSSSGVVSTSFDSDDDADQRAKEYQRLPSTPGERKPLLAGDTYRSFSTFSSREDDEEKVIADDDSQRSSHESIHSSPNVSKLNEGLPPPPVPTSVPVCAEEVLRDLEASKAENDIIKQMSKDERVDVVHRRVQQYVATSGHIDSMISELGPPPKQVVPKKVSVSKKTESPPRKKKRVKKRKSKSEKRADKEAQAKAEKKRAKKRRQKQKARQRKKQKEEEAKREAETLAKFEEIKLRLGLYSNSDEESGEEDESEYDEEEHETEVVENESDEPEQLEDVAEEVVQENSDLVDEEESEDVVELAVEEVEEVKSPEEPTPATETKKRTRRRRRKKNSSKKNETSQTNTPDRSRNKATPNNHSSRSGDNSFRMVQSKSKRRKGQKTTSRRERFTFKIPTPEVPQFRPPMAPPVLSVPRTTYPVQHTPAIVKPAPVTVVTVSQPLEKPTNETTPLPAPPPPPASVTKVEENPSPIPIETTQPQPVLEEPKPEPADVSTQTLAPSQPIPEQPFISQPIPQIGFWKPPFEEVPPQPTSDDAPPPPPPPSSGDNALSPTESRRPTKPPVTGLRSFFQSKVDVGTSTEPNTYPFESNDHDESHVDTGDHSTTQTHDTNSVVTGDCDDHSTSVSTRSGPVHPQPPQSTNKSTNTLPPLQDPPQIPRLVNQNDMFQVPPPPAAPLFMPQMYGYPFPNLFVPPIQPQSNNDILNSRDTIAALAAVTGDLTTRPPMFMPLPSTFHFPQFPTQFPFQPLPHLQPQPIPIPVPVPTQPQHQHTTSPLPRHNITQPSQHTQHQIHPNFAVQPIPIPIVDHTPIGTEEHISFEPDVTDSQNAPLQNVNVFSEDTKTQENGSVSENGTNNPPSDLASARSDHDEVPDLSNQSHEGSEPALDDMKNSDMIQHPDANGNDDSFVSFQLPTKYSESMFQLNAKVVGGDMSIAKLLKFAES